MMTNAAAANTIPGLADEHEIFSLEVARDMPAAITALGHHVPNNVLDNDFFESTLDISREWIVARTGIERRHILQSGGTSELIVPAALQCLKNRGLRPDGVDCIIVATITPDYIFPSTAAVVQAKLGAHKAWGFDISAACCGFLMALIVGARFIETGAAKSVLVCGADRMSSITNYEDRTSAPLFGDAAGVVLLEQSSFTNLGVIDHVASMNGSEAQSLYMPAGGSACPTSADSVAARQHYLVQDGPTVYKAAVAGMANVTAQLMARNELTADKIQWLVPHQANKRIIESVGARLRIKPERVMCNIESHGNTCAATIPLALSQWNHQLALDRGDRILLTSFGAGFTAVAVYVRWSIPRLAVRPLHPTRVDAAGVAA